MVPRGGNAAKENRRVQRGDRRRKRYWPSFFGASQVYIYAWLSLARMRVARAIQLASVPLELTSLDTVRRERGDRGRPPNKFFYRTCSRKDRGDDRGRSGTSARGVVL